MHLDKTARRIVREAHEEDPEATIRLVANEPDRRDKREYEEKELEERADHHIPSGDVVIFVEITVDDPSNFESELYVLGEERHGYRILRARSATVPNAIAALLLHLRDLTGRVPHVYFEWDRGQPGHQHRPLPALRRRRGRPGDPRGAPRGRARPRPPPGGPRRLTRPPDP